MKTLIAIILLLVSCVTSDYCSGTAFSASFTASFAPQNIVGTTYQRLIFPLLDLDEFGTYNLTSGVFTIPVNGTYEFQAFIVWQPPYLRVASTTKVDASFFRNGGNTRPIVGTMANDREESNSSPSFSQSFFIILSLVQGNTVDFRVNIFAPTFSQNYPITLGTFTGKLLHI